MPSFPARGCFLIGNVLTPHLDNQREFGERAEKQNKHGCEMDVRVRGRHLEGHQHLSRLTSCMPFTILCLTFLLSIHSRSSEAHDVDIMRTCNVSLVGTWGFAGLADGDYIRFESNGTWSGRGEIIYGPTNCNSDFSWSLSSAQSDGGSTKNRRSYNCYRLLHVTYDDLDNSTLGCPFRADRLKIFQYYFTSAVKSPSTKRACLLDTSAPLLVYELDGSSSTTPCDKTTFYRVPSDTSSWWPSWGRWALVGVFIGFIAGVVAVVVALCIFRCAKPALGEEGHSLGGFVRFEDEDSEVEGLMRNERRGSSGKTTRS
jgi:hypothetical protein